jgi:hypothetical protein
MVYPEEAVAAVAAAAVAAAVVAAAVAAVVAAAAAAVAGNTDFPGNTVAARAGMAAGTAAARHTGDWAAKTRV